MSPTPGTRRGRIGAALALLVATTLLPGTGDGAAGDVAFDFGPAPAEPLVILRVPDGPAPAPSFLDPDTPAPGPAAPQVLAPPEPPTAGSLLDLLASRPDLSTFLSAVQAVGLDEALDTGGPFTVFAPTNAAFLLLPPETLETLRTDREALALLVRHHLAGGALDATAVANQRTLTMVSGDDLPIEATGAALLVGEAQVTAPDLAATNGVAHLVDRVLRLEAEPSLLEALRDAGTFSLLLDALDRAGLAPLLEGEGPYTVLAPSDQAFAALSAADREALLGDPTALAQWLRGLVVRGRVTSAELAAAGRVTTLGGTSWDVAADGDALFVGGGAVLAPDLVATNGVVHGLDAVFLASPEEKDTLLDDAFPADDLDTLASTLTDPDLVLAPAEADDATLAAPGGAPAAELPAAYGPLIASTQALTDALLVAATRRVAPAASVTSVAEVATAPGGLVQVDPGEDVVALSQMVIRVVHVQGAAGVTHTIDLVAVRPGSLASVPTSRAQVAGFVASLRDQGVLSSFDPPPAVTTTFAPITSQTDRLPPAATAALLGNPVVLTQNVVRDLVTGAVDRARIVAFTPGLVLDAPNVQTYPSGRSLRVDFAVMTVGAAAATGGFVVIRDTAILLPAP